jgi:hypothetical protein
VSSITPGGIDCQFSVLSTAAVIRTSSPGDACSVMSTSNGV